MPIFVHLTYFKKNRHFGAEVNQHIRFENQNFIIELTIIRKYKEGLFDMLNVLMAVSEAAPFAKTGGLADVAGSLPKALIKGNENVKVAVIMPFYKTIPQNLRDKIEHKKYIYVRVGWRNQYCGIMTCKYENVDFYFIDNEYYFGRAGLYGYEDDAERFAYFCRAVLEAIPHIDFTPDIIHCHDWQTGMIPFLMKTQYQNNPIFKDIKTVFTIHNLKYQGIFPKSILHDLFSIDLDEYFTDDKLEFNGNANFMKAGIVYSDKITTVSPTYAGEIQYPFFGEGLHGILNARKNSLYGILNGIDYDEYNPSIDSHIFYKYNNSNLDFKNQNKLKLQESLNLPKRIDVPIVSIISRLVSQKGIDLIKCVLHKILQLDVQMVILGTGDKHYESLFKNAAYNYRGKVSANIMFDDDLAHKVYAGSDLLLMPSLFEPCGLGQIISLRYGCIPIVRETGGLKDTVTSFNEITREGNGFSFTNYNAHDMLYTIERAIKIYKDDKTWAMLVKRAMECDYSWNASARRYLELYDELIQ
jgi:starch synthase